MHQQAGPHRGRSMRHARHRFRDHMCHVRGRGRTPSENHRCTTHERGQRNAPAQHVINRHRTQEFHAVANTKSISGAQAHRVQPQRAVAVNHALGRPFRTGGIADGRRSSLLQHRPFVVRGPPIQELLIHAYLRVMRKIAGERPRHINASLIRARENHSLDGGAVAQHRDQPLAVGGIAHNHPILRVIDHVNELIIHQVAVEWVEDRAHRGHRQHRLQVFSAVGEKRAHAIADLNPVDVPETKGQRTRTRRDLLKRQHFGLLSEEGFHCCGVVRRGSELKDASHRERDFLHGGLHDSLGYRCDYRRVEVLGLTPSSQPSLGEAVTVRLKNLFVRRHLYRHPSLLTTAGCREINLKISTYRVA